MTRTECACASSSVALYDATYAIESGRFKNILVIGVEKMTLLDTKGMTAALAGSSYYPEEGSQGMTFPGLFAELAKSYRDFYKFDDETLRKMLAHVAALCYKNAASNPLAQVQNGPATAEAILELPDDPKARPNNMIIAPPLRIHDCSLVSDGAAAVVLSANSSLPSGAKAVSVAGIGQSAEYLPLSKREKRYMLEAGKDAVAKSFKEAGITANDIDFAEVHDCFTINQLLTTEALGLSEDGKAGFAYMEGRFTPEDDKVSVNLSGGLKAKGHPVGATGASMHALAYKQLIGEPIGATRAKQAETGVIFNVGGSAVTNCVTVLRRTQ
jgi:acetyl-CoA C-acetyltransferase